jgi:hypothetical protein
MAAQPGCNALNDPALAAMAHLITHYDILFQLSDFKKNLQNIEA